MDDFSTLVLRYLLPPVMLTSEEKTSLNGKDPEPGVQVTPAPVIEEEEFFPDGGLRAWLVVVGCFIITAVVVGFWYVSRYMFREVCSLLLFPAS
jgi:hypothetical protein